MLFCDIIKDVNKWNEQELLEAMIQTIEDKSLRIFVTNIINDCDLLETYKKQASSSSKYHPVISAGDYGLLRHTALALLVLDTFILFYKPTGKLNEDVCRVALILHDAWKYHDIKNIVSKFVTKEHGFVGAKNILEYYIKTKSLIDIEVIGQVASAVKYHMSHWTHLAEDQQYVRSKATLNERVVMICDFISSNKALFELAQERK